MLAWQDRRQVGLSSVPPLLGLNTGGGQPHQLPLCVHHGLATTSPHQPSHVALGTLDGTVGGVACQIGFDTSIILL